jgi:hypothetical protein
MAVSCEGAYYICRDTAPEPNLLHVYAQVSKESAAEFNETRGATENETAQPFSEETNSNLRFVVLAREQRAKKSAAN